LLSWVSKPKKARKGKKHPKKERKKERKKKNFLNYLMGKKDKTEVGNDDGEGVKNPEEIWPYRDSF